MTEPNLLEFRRHLGELAAGKTDAELAEMHATLQWVADQAITKATQASRQPEAPLRRSA